MGVTAGDVPVPCSAEVRVTAEITPDVDSTHPEVRFDAEKPGSITIQLAPRRQGQPLRLLQAYVDVSGFTVHLNSEASAVTVSYDPAGPGRSAAGAMLLVQTNSTIEQWVALPVIVATASTSRSDY
jgi:hypothetical protein